MPSGQKRHMLGIHAIRRKPILFLGAKGDFGTTKKVLERARKNPRRPRESRF